MTVAQALWFFNEGKQAFLKHQTRLPYTQESPEARWWAKGWLFAYNKAKEEAA